MALPDNRERKLLGKIAAKTLTPSPDQSPRSQTISAVVDLIHNDEVFGQMWGQLSQAVGLLNQYFDGQQIQAENPVPLNYAAAMKKDIDQLGISHLPTPDQLLDTSTQNHRTWRLLADLIHVFKKTSSFDFLTQYDTEMAFYGEAVAVFGKLLVATHPGLKDGASVLEEIFAVMQFNGQPNQFFAAAKDWYFEEEEGTPGNDPGFSHGLVEKIKNHLPQTS